LFQYWFWQNTLRFNGRAPFRSSSFKLAIDDQNQNWLDSALSFFFATTNILTTKT
jgi:hypothetical protein